MNINFTMQDLITFLIGLGVTLILVVGQALAGFSEGTDASTWLNALVPALLTALGRYIVTYISQKAVTVRGADPDTHRLEEPRR